MDLDPTMCILDKGSCFSSTEKAAEYIAYAMSQGDTPTIADIYSVRGGVDPYTPDPTPVETEMMWVILSTSVFVIIVMVLVGVLVQVVRKRQKRAHGTTWFPEGWAPTTSAPSAGPTTPITATTTQQQSATRRRPDGGDEDK